jgi:Flp pilus assembly pilin Flp
MSLSDELGARMRSEQGQTFVEYGLILAALVVGALMTVTWTGLAGVMQSALTAVSSAL